MKKTILILTLATFTAVFSGCSKRSKEGSSSKQPKIAVTVDGHKLTWKEMDKRAESFLNDEVNIKGLTFPENKREEALEFFRRRAVKIFVFKTLFMAEAKRQRVQIDDGDRKQGLEKLALTLKKRNQTPEEFFASSPLGEKFIRAEFEDGLLIDKLLEKMVKDKIKVTDDDMDAVAEEISKQRAEQRKNAIEVRQKLLGGADFAEMAQKYSTSPSAAAGGDVGEFERGKCKYGNDVDNAAFKQKVGAIGDIIEGRDGFLIIKVTSRTPAKKETATTPAVPETARASIIKINAPSMSGKEIHNEVMRRKYAKGVDEYYQELRKPAKVECAFTDLVL